MPANIRRNIPVRFMSHFHKPVQNPEMPRDDWNAQSADIDDLRHSLESALRLQNQTRHELDLLNEILAQLPVAVTVQSEDGTTLFTNKSAKAIGEQAPAEGGAAPCEAKNAEQLGRATRDPDQAITHERRFLSAAGLRTLLTTQKSVLVGEEWLRVATSLDITERKQIEEELSRRANFDELTGLPNRYQFQERVEALLSRPDAHFAVAIIDIDNFKQINDFTATPSATPS